MGGAASGKYGVKSCGNAHAWCSRCRPEVAEHQRKPKPPPKPGMPPCRKCGRCDHCLALSAPEGMKVCRGCGATKPVEAFARRADTGGRRNRCIACSNSSLKSVRCEGCNRWYVKRDTTARTLCSRCRPSVTKPCARCGTEFVGSMEQRRYCSAECRDAALKEKIGNARLAQRLAALRAYSTGEPACACCGESGLLFLALDHVNGGGHKQRKELGGGGFYVWLRKNGYPEGFQVLCHNCNLGRQFNGGTCPHLMT